MQVNVKCYVYVVCRRVYPGFWSVSVNITSTVQTHHWEKSNQWESQMKLWSSLLLVQKHLNMSAQVLQQKPGEMKHSRKSNWIPPQLPRCPGRYRNAGCAGVGLPAVMQTNRNHVERKRDRNRAAVNILSNRSNRRIIGPVEVGTVSEPLWVETSGGVVEWRMDDGLLNLRPEGRFDIITVSLWSLQRKPWSRRWRIEDKQ